MILLSGLVLIILGAVFSLIRWQAAHNNPDRIFRDALLASMSTTKVQATAVEGPRNVQTQYDFSDLRNPVVSTKAKVQLAGANFELNGYGTSQNTYVSYKKLPAGISPAVVSAIQSGWIQLRAKGIQPPGVSAVLARVSDPRYLASGPVVFGNFPERTRIQLVDFLIGHHAYSYDPAKISHTKLNGTKVTAYTIKPNVGYLKIANQSAASSESFTLDNVQDAINALDALKGANLMFYIRNNDHRLQQVTISHNGTTASTLYSAYNQLDLPNEPQTRLTWQDFAKVQWQVESQAASHQPASALDATRRSNLASLHPYLAQYFAQNNTYPSLTNLNDQTWVASHFSGLDPSLLRDPLALNLALGTMAKAGAFAYQPKGADARKVCDAATNACMHYKLIATLSDNQQFIVQDP